jgi:ribosomal protein L7Ae-like RNA K-turn-binding protein
MLENLDKFQRRAIEKDPVHGKLKLRFVSGLKQTTNGVKAGRARLVLLATDTEESQALDEKFIQLLEEAKNKSIPVMYCMTRRKLAKSIGSTFRQSAVAIYDPDGAYPEFKQIIAFFETKIQTINSLKV